MVTTAAAKTSFGL